MHIPVLAVVENMSYITCSNWGKLAAACDARMIELFDGGWLDGVMKKLTSDNDKGASRNMEDNIMKVAVASMGNMVAGHFGHCENFNIYKIVSGVVTSAQSISNPGHKPGFLPNFLGDMGVEVIIAGGMGGGAMEIFNERNIEVIVGTQGDVRAAVESYLRGDLESTGSICHEHEYADECGEK